MLEVKDLRVSFQTYGGEVQAVRGASFVLKDGGVLAIVGESGCGKSVTAQTIMRLHDPEITRIKGGDILLDGRDLLSLTELEMQAVRGREISMIFQDPMTSLNPSMSIGEQIIEILRKHVKDDEGKPISRSDAREQAIELLRAVKLPNPESRFNRFPHEFSGGQRQRIMIAMAMACRPKVLIADEPTTALDVTVQAQILALMKELRDQYGTSVILITHDLGVVAQIADNVAVMYGGMVVESGSAQDIFHCAEHPYTHGLLSSVSRLNLDKEKPLRAIEGTPPDLVDPPKGCPFADRCEYAMQICHDYLPEEVPLAGEHRCRCWLLDPECPVKPEWRDDR
ncbi:MAG: ABC transporter ATP-binding protein [Clostridia bacterium]|nr:ABC transporter ATP-binding protein [Clostridia bacterium]